MFSQVATQWEMLITQSEDSSVVVNAYQWAERLTMETIGQSVSIFFSHLSVTEAEHLQAAFGIRFGAIEGESHELAQ